MVQPKRYRCKKCRHIWWARVKEPIQCPVCKRTDWNKERTKK